MGVAAPSSSMLDRLTRFPTNIRRPSVNEGISYAEQLQRKVRQVEKIVRISDGYQAMLQDLNARSLASRRMTT
jgi:diguanylate cyclase